MLLHVVLAGFLLEWGLHTAPPGMYKLLINWCRISSINSSSQLQQKHFTLRHQLSHCLTCFQKHIDSVCPGLVPEVKQYDFFPNFQTRKSQQPYTPENERLEPENTPPKLEKEKHQPKPPNFWLQNVSFRGVIPAKKNTSTHKTSWPLVGNEGSFIPNIPM